MENWKIYDNLQRDNALKLIFMHYYTNNMYTLCMLYEILAL